MSRLYYWEVITEDKTDSRDHLKGMYQVLKSSRIAKEFENV